MKTYKALSMTEQIAIQEENEKLKAEKNSLIARIADLTLEKADMRAKLQGIEEYCEHGLKSCYQDIFCGKEETYKDILSQLKANR